MNPMTPEEHLEARAEQLVEAMTAAVMEWHASLGDEPMTTEQYVREQSRIALNVVRTERSGSGDLLIESLIAGDANARSATIGDDK